MCRAGGLHTALGSGSLFVSIGSPADPLQHREPVAALT